MEYAERALREIQCENKREMTTIRRSRFYGLRQFLASVSKYTWAALALTLAFFVLCACTIGGFTSTGGSFYAATDSEIVFYLDYQNSAKLDAVYVNVGTVHASVGSTVKFEVRRSSVYSTGPSWMSTYLGEAEFGNVFSFDEDTISDTGYNWTALFEGIYTEDGHSITNNLVRITVPCDMVKLSREIALGCLYDEKRRQFLCRLIKAFKELGLVVCIEGIQDEEMYARLEGLAPDQLQGYCFAKPSNAEEMLALLLEASVVGAGEASA